MNFYIEKFFLDKKKSMKKLNESSSKFFYLNMKNFFKSDIFEQEEWSIVLLIKNYYTHRSSL